MMKIIKDLLIKIINDIDTGNSNLSADELKQYEAQLAQLQKKGTLQTDLI